jgi:hypothetical protein
MISVLIWRFTLVLIKIKEKKSQSIFFTLADKKSQDKKSQVLAIQNLFINIFRMKNNKSFILTSLCQTVKTGFFVLDLQVIV